MLAGVSVADAHPFHDDGAIMPGDPECYDFDAAPMELAPGVDISKVLEGVKKYKDAYLGFRCDAILRFMTDGYFSEFEKKGLTVKQIHDKLGELIKLAEKVPNISSDMVAQLKAAQDVLAGALKAPGVGDILVRCKPDCGKKTVQCSMKAPATDWVDFPEF
jgi:hypothetical protein